MSAFADTDDRDRALRLIRYRALEIVTINGGAKGIVEAIEDDRQYAGVLHGVLELFVTIAPKVLTDLGMLALDAALLDIATYDQSTDHRLAAELILAHERVGVDALGENVFRDLGAGDFDRGIDQMDDRGRAREILLGVVDVWLQLLSVLRTDEGMQLLEEHAKGLD